MKTKQKFKIKERGITLIALVITIIILLILAAVTIAALSGDNGILSNAARAKQETEKAEVLEQIRLDIYGEMSDNQGKAPTEADIKRIADNYGDIEGTNFDNMVLKTEKGNYEIKLSDIWTAGSSTQDPIDPPSTTLQPGEIATAERNEYYDAEADKTAKIPIGFTVSDKEGETSINGGLVVYAPDNSEYVWIPVDGIIGEDGDINDVNAENIEDRKILLGRYVFKDDGTVDTTEGTTPTTMGGQLKISSTDSYYYTEDTTGKGNTVATGEKGIDSFIQSVRDNGGYYIGRYEAGDGNATANRTSSSPNNNPIVVKSGQYVYNYVTQSQASSLCQNLYTGVNSDLVNSYAWDTAILFIQKYSGDNDYSRQIGKSTTRQIALTGEGKLSDTNDSDKQCNIYDMAGNCREWTTETYSLSNYPCVFRGGYCNSSSTYTSYRYYNDTTYSHSTHSFRSLLYL